MIFFIVFSIWLTYAEVNTVGVIAESINSILFALHDVLKVMLTWFRDNHIHVGKC